MMKKQRKVLNLSGSPRWVNFVAKISKWTSLSSKIHSERWQIRYHCQRCIFAPRMCRQPPKSIWAWPIEVPVQSYENFQRGIPTRTKTQSASRSARPRVSTLLGRLRLMVARKSSSWSWKTRGWCKSQMSRHLKVQAKRPRALARHFTSRGV